MKRFLFAVVWLGALQLSSAWGSPLWTVTTASTGLNSFVSKSIPSSVAWAPDGTLGLVYYDFNPRNWVYRTFDGTDWSTGQVIATMSAQGASTYVSWQRWAELQYDSLGRPRVAYLNNGTTTGTSDDRLVLAYNNGSGWVNVPVGSESTGGNIGLHLDANGNANISYYNSSALSAKFATRMQASGYVSGTISIVQSGSSAVGSYGTDVIRDAGGTLHVVYFDANSFPSALFHERSTNNGSTWTNRTQIEQATGTGRTAFPSLALDGSGNPAVAFVDTGADTLHFARFNGTTWLKELVPVPDVGSTDVYTIEGATLAYYGDTPYIAFVDGLRRLNIAWKNSLGNWEFQFVADTATYPLISSLAYPFLRISPDGQAAISFYDYTQTTGGTMFVAMTNLNPIPEPSSFALVGIGCCTLCGYRYRRRRAAADSNS